MKLNKILIWGTGYWAKDFIDNGYNAEIIGFIETNKSKNEFMQKPVYSVSEIPDGYDYIIVASSYGMEIYAACCMAGIDISKLIFLHRNYDRVGCIEDSILKEILSEKNYYDYYIRFQLWPKRRPIPEGGGVDLVYADAEKYRKLNKRPSFDIQDKYMWLFVADKYGVAARIDDYFTQDLWAAKLVYKSGVRKHYDIGSRVQGFIAHLLTVGIDVSIIDIRELPGEFEVENLHTIVDDATYLKNIPDDSVESMSALCSLEHFGLGRYGDPVDHEACFKCFEQMQRKLKKGGRLYISVPVGWERVEFNAHRVFYASTIIECFSNMILQEFSYSSDGKMEYEVSDIHKFDNDKIGYGFGLFYFIKK